MFRLARRSARAHWRRFVLTAVAVVVGVSFVDGSFVLTDSLAASINRLLSDATTHTDFVVRPVDAGGGRGLGGGRGGGGGGFGGGGGGRGGSQAVPSDLVATLRSISGVAAADPTVAGGAILIRKGEKATISDGAALTNWPDHPQMNAIHLLSGHAPSGPNDVVIDSNAARRHSFHVGDAVQIGVRREQFGLVDAHVSGIAQVGSGNLGVAGSLVAVTLPRATELVGTPGKVDGISVQLAPGVDRNHLRQELVDSAGPTMSVLSADALLADAQQRIQDRLGLFNGLMLGFASVTLFVSAFLIWNTFSMVIAQRRREIALLRAVGATAKQVRQSVVAEAAIVGAVASGVGLGVGVLIAIGLRKLLGSFGIDLPSSQLVVLPRTIIVGFVVGLGVTLVSVIVPAWRTTRIPPIGAMQTAALPMPATGITGPIIGSVAMLMGIMLGATGLLRTTATTNSRLLMLAVSAVLIFIGMVILARFLAGPVIGAIAMPFKRLGGVGSSLARQNAVRDPRRTAATASALMIGLALVATTVVLGESVKSSFGGALRASIKSDAIVAAGGIVSFNDANIRSIETTAGVAHTAVLSAARARATGLPVTADDSRRGERDGQSRVGISIGDLTSIASAVDPGFDRGGWPTDDQHLAISKSFADERKLALGGVITLVGDTNRVLTISGIYERDELLDDAVARPGAIVGLPGVEPVTKLLFVDVSGPVGPVVAALDRSVSAIPFASARTSDDYVTNETNSLDVVLTIVDVLLAFAIAVATMGITNTLALSVVERTREIGLLRAVGMNKASVRRMVRVEGILVALLGGVLGLGLGIAFGAATASVLPADTAQLTFPTARLVALFVAAGVLGVIASAVPARRAAKLDVLDAIAED